MQFVSSSASMAETVEQTTEQILSAVLPMDETLERVEFFALNFSGDDSDYYGAQKFFVELAAGEKLSEAKLCDVLSQVGLCAREYIDREVSGSLSGGEIKRIEIATVLARHTKLSLFDEPEAGIDLWSFTNLIDVFQSLRGKLKGTLIIISHQERILQIAAELVVISGGTLKEKGPAQEILPGLMAGNIQCDACAKREAVFS